MRKKEYTGDMRDAHGGLYFVVLIIVLCFKQSRVIKSIYHVLLSVTLVTQSFVSLCGHVFV